jgi:TetR/AcrR family transcriptional repressor of lmrAB and yxaGH operons
MALMARETAASKAKMILATLDLLRSSGLSGAGLNSVVAASGAPKGSLYHFFPGGKHELVAAALRQAEVAIGDGFKAIFSGTMPLPHKVRSLFETTAERTAATGFTKGCPVAAVTLDLDDASEDLRPISDAVFAAWRQIIGSGLNEIPLGERDRVAQLILAALEGALILARAQASAEPLVDIGRLLAKVLSRTFPKSAEKQNAAKPATVTGSKRRSR